jgi:hypothetical protein
MLDVTFRFGEGLPQEHSDTKVQDGHRYLSGSLFNSHGCPCTLYMYRSISSDDGQHLSFSLARRMMSWDEVDCLLL